jgi:hypothetical protein
VTHITNSDWKLDVFKGQKQETWDGRGERVLREFAGQVAAAAFFL